VSSRRILEARARLDFIVFNGNLSRLRRSLESVLRDGSLDAKNAVVVEVGLDLTRIDTFRKRELAANLLVDLVVAVMRLLALLGIDTNDSVVDADLEIFRSKVGAHSEVDETLLVVAFLNDAGSDGRQLTEVRRRHAHAKASDARKEFVDRIPSAQVTQGRVPGVNVSAVTREW